MKKDDLLRLAHEVRLFLNKTSILGRFGGTASVYLELPNVGAMHAAEKAIIAVLTDTFDIQGTNNGRPFRFVDSETLVLDTYAGVSIVLTCNQRFAAERWDGYRKGFGYRNVNFVHSESIALSDEARSGLAEITRLRARVAELEADRDRIERNRDMWKGQCERQAERLTEINAQLRIAEVDRALTDKGEA